MKHSQSLTLIGWDSSHCSINSDNFNFLSEPPDAEPHVRWCGRTGAARLPPTRLQHFAAVPPENPIWPYNPCTYDTFSGYCSAVTQTSFSTFERSLMFIFQASFLLVRNLLMS